MRNSWKGYVCFSLSESLGLYKQNTWTCLCSFFFTFQGLLGRACVSAVPGVIREERQHNKLTTQRWVAVFGVVPGGCCLTTKGLNSGRLFVLHPWVPFESVHIGEGVSLPFFHSQGPTHWAEARSRAVERVRWRRSSPWSALSYPMGQRKFLHVLLLLRSKIPFTQAELGLIELIPHVLWVTGSVRRRLHARAT